MFFKPQEEAAAPAEAHRQGWLPARIRIADYPGIKELAWQVHGPQELTPREALGIYERNWRHLDPATLSAAERDLVDALRLALGNDSVFERPHHRRVARVLEALDGSRLRES